MSKEHVIENLQGLNAPASASAVAASVVAPDVLRTPEAQAATNAIIAEAVKSVFAQLGPLLESMSLTPAKIAEAEKMRRAKPPEEIARELRERQMMQLDLQEAEARKKENQSACSHRYPTGQSAFHVIHNFPDRQPRFSCPLCGIWVAPRQWMIGPPTQEEPRGHAFIAEAHPLYQEAFKAMASKGV